jgi:putative ABC transport system permease protein
VLNYVFEVENALLTSGIILVMIVSSAQIVIGHSGLHLKTFFPIIGGIGFITIVLIGFFFIFVILGMDLSKWATPQYIIPIIGMLLGNSMNAGVLALKGIKDAVSEKKALIEQKLALGATPGEALGPELKNAFRTAILPSMSSMAGMGLVSLPGMMTGQILSGTSPLIAVKYQIAIVLAISAAVGVSAFLIVRVSYHKFFTEAWQILDRKKKNSY